MTVNVRPQRPVDARAVRAVVTDAFGDTGRVADLAEDLLAGPSRVALVAELDSLIVGHVQLSRGWLDAPRELVDVLVLSPLATTPRHQRTGIGSELVRAALSAAGELRAPLVFLEGVPAFYPRFGFEPGRPLGFTPPSTRIPDRAFLVARLPAYQPWMSGAFVYPDAFWVHDCVGLRETDPRRAG